VDILDDMGVSKLSAKVFFKVNYSFNSLLCILRYSDGDLTLIYPDGSRCSTGFQRMTIINFECNATAGE